MQQLYVQLPIDDADVLQTAGSALRRCPEAGKYRMWCGSDQADGQISVTVNGVLVVEPSEMPVITVNQLRLDGPPTYEWTAGQGEDVIINYNEVTAGTASSLIRHLSVFDLMVEAGKSPAAAYAIASEVS